MRVRRGHAGENQHFAHARGVTKADCGPDCYTMGDSSRYEFRFDGARWATPVGIWTTDGRIFVNNNGVPGTLV